MSTSTMKKLVLLGVVLLIVIFFFAFDLDSYLTLEMLKMHQANLQQWYAENTLLFAAIYFCVYIIVVAINLPGAAIMTLAGGAMMGFWMGVVVVSFASSIGATAACLVSRYLLRESIQRKFGDKLEKINQGVEKEGAFYLFSLRLIPIFPFFVINLVFGLTKMRLWTFYWVSQVGMLAGTAVYVNAGKEIGKLDSLSGILSPSLIASFVALGLFPLAAKKIIEWYRGKQGTTA